MFLGLEVSRGAAQNATTAFTIPERSGRAGLANCAKLLGAVAAREALLYCRWRDEPICRGEFSVVRYARQ